MEARQRLAVVRRLVWRGLLRQVSRRRPNPREHGRCPCPSGRFLERRAAHHPFRRTRQADAGHPEQPWNWFPRCQDSVAQKRIPSRVKETL